MPVNAGKSKLAPEPQSPDNLKADSAGAMDYARVLNISALLARFPAALSVVLLAPLAAQTCAPGELRVLVIDSQVSPIFDAEVRAASGNSFLSSLSTEAA